LIFRKIIKIVATRCEILKLKFDFGWGSAPDPLAGFKGPSSKGRGGKGRGGGRGRERRGRGRERGGEGKGEGGEERELTALSQTP